MNSCRDLLALFPLHELFTYHTRLIHTTPSDKHCRAPVCTESPGAARPGTRRPLSPSAAGGLHACSTKCQTHVPHHHTRSQSHPILLQLQGSIRFSTSWHLSAWHPLLQPTASTTSGAMLHGGPQWGRQVMWCLLGSPSLWLLPFLPTELAVQ